MVGMAAALGAGMRCLITYTNSTASQQFPGADTVSGRRRGGHVLGRCPPAAHPRANPSHALTCYLPPLSLFLLLSSPPQVLFNLEKVTWADLTAGKLSGVDDRAAVKA